MFWEGLGLSRKRDCNILDKIYMSRLVSSFHSRALSFVLLLYRAPTAATLVRNNTCCSSLGLRGIAEMAFFWYSIHIKLRGGRPPGSRAVGRQHGEMGGRSSRKPVTGGGGGGGKEASRLTAQSTRVVSFASRRYNSWCFF